MQFSPDGSLLAAGDPPFVRIWEIATGKETRRLRTNQNPHHLAFSADGQRLSVVDNRAAWSWEVSSGRELSVHEGVRSSGYPTILSPDGRILAQHDSKNGQLLLIDVAQGTTTALGPAQSCNGLAAFSADASTVAAAGIKDSATIFRFWDVASGKETRQVASSHKAHIRALALSPDGRFLAYGAAKQEKNEMQMALLVCDATTGKQVHELALPAQPARDMYYVKLGFSPDGQTLACWRDYDTVVHMWDVQTGKRRHPFEGSSARVERIAFTANGETLVTQAFGEALHVWDAATGRERRQVACFPKALESPPTTCFALAPNSRTLAATSGKDELIRVYDISTGLEELPFRGVPTRVTSLSFSPDGRTLRSWGDGAPQVGRIWDVASRTEKPAVELPKAVGIKIVSLDGLAALEVKEQDREDVVTLWDLKTAKARWSVRSHRGEFHAASFSPKGSLLLRRSAFGPALCLHDALTGRLLRKLPGMGEATFSPDENMLAVTGRLGGRDFRFELGGGRSVAGIEGGARVIQLWHLKTGKERSRLTGVLGAVAFSADGTKLACVADDSTPTIWDIAAVPAPPDSSIERTASEMEELWTSLTGLNREKTPTLTALQLVESPRQTVPLFRERLIPATKADVVEGLIADLDDGSFERRQQASAELLKLGRTAKAALQRALGSKPALEVCRRIEELLAKMPADVSLLQRECHAVEVLEMINNDAARKLLKELASAQLLIDNRVTEEAKAALERVGNP
jgi:WD40 repeat protein